MERLKIVSFGVAMLFWNGISGNAKDSIIIPSIAIKSEEMLEAKPNKNLGIVCAKPNPKPLIPLVIVNNKIIGFDELGKLDQDSIMGIQVVKNQRAIDLFGSGARHGAIIVLTRQKKYNNLK